MSNPYFRFKQFTVYHDLCAMKVGTDGVLLGAWTDVANASTILDAGTGSGVIALMLAQRTFAGIDAIEIDESAYIQSVKNFNLSPFSLRLKAVYGDFSDYFPDKKYDLIVSNPPFFVDSLKSPDQQRTLARHADDLPFDKLIWKSSELLSFEGRLSLILPIGEFNIIHSIAESYGLYLRRKTEVRPIAYRPSKRILAEYSKQQGDLQENELSIEQSYKVYSDEFIALMKDYYLRM